MSDYYIPDELLTKIITYLPVKSLMRFSCLCKSWHSLITSSDFITTHHLNQTRALSNNNHLLLVRCCQHILDKERISLHVDNDTSYLCEKLDFPFESSEPDFNVYGSCNGLILLSKDLLLLRNNSLMLWNPSIRKSLTLPPVRNIYFADAQSFAFGFDSRTNDYKVVRLVFRQSSKGKAKVELYKLSTRSWETITASFDPSCIVYHENYLGETFLNGAVHWRAHKMGSCIIISFNVSDEEFSEIMLPPNFHMGIRFDIAISGEWLSLFQISNSMHCSVWAMKEYGVVESWTKLYTLNLWHGIALMTPLGFRKNGELLLRKHWGELFSYDSETHQFKYLGQSYACRPSCANLCKFKAYYLDAYMESLVLLGDANRLGAGDEKQAKKKRKNRFADS